MATATTRRKSKATKSKAKAKKSSGGNQELLFLRGLHDAIDANYGMIQFDPDGTIVDVNDNFLSVVGYSREEVIGQHHRIFCDHEYRESTDYRHFWDKLSSGQAQTGEFKRIEKGGKEVWINAAYSPLKDSKGQVYKVVKVASDITEVKAAAMMKQMVDLSPINTMYADPEGILLYMNKNSESTLKRLEEHLPDKVENFVGSSIDQFHKNPSHQRRIIADPKNLPIRSKIKVGPETLDLLVSPIYDSDGAYKGPMVTWSIITDQLRVMSALEETSNQLGAAAEELSATATQLNQNSSTTEEQATGASASTEEVSKGVQVVATNTEELVASIKEISRNTADAAGVSKETREKAQATNETIQKLGTSSEEIGNVIKVISSIAQQTNLLALNATIEAARAGEAGKGFAVVANEVKELAKQTANATDDITNRINSIQSDTRESVKEMTEIAEFIEKLNSISVSIAAAVEEQTATANEVARVVQESNQGVNAISEVIQNVTGAAKQSSAGAAQTLEAAQSLSKLAEDLRELVKSVDV